MWPRYFLQQKRPAPAATVKLKEKRLRPLSLAPSPLQGLPSQELQEGEDWEQEDKDEDISPRLVHSPSVQAGELMGGGWNCHSGGKKSLSLPSCLASFLDSESPSPEEVPDYLLWVPCHFQFYQALCIWDIKVNFLGTGSFGGQWYWRWQYSAPGRQYRAIHSAEQHHAYKQDFETDYAEYRTLHARVGAANQRFRELGAEMKSTQRGTPEYKVRAGWAQAGPWALLAVNSWLTAHNPVCSTTNVISKPVLREKLVCRMRREVPSLPKRTGAFFLRLNLVLTFSVSDAGRKDSPGI